MSEAEGKRGSPRPISQVKARTVARAAHERPRIAQGGAWPAGRRGAMSKDQTFVGIDVSKARLDVAVGSADELFGVDNDAHGVANLVGRLRKLGPH